VVRNNFVVAEFAAQIPLGDVIGDAMGFFTIYLNAAGLPRQCTSDLDDIERAKASEHAWLPSAPA
jgi:hypothetical protein